MGLLYLHQFLLQGVGLIYFTTNNLIDIARKELLDGLNYQIFLCDTKKLFFSLCILHDYTFTPAICCSMLGLIQEKKKNFLFHEYKYLIV